MNKKVRAAVFDRAMYECESGCGTSITPEIGRLDHFFGRAKAPETVENCWALCCPCDEDKTANRPSALHWYGLFLIHAARCRYWVQAERALARIFILEHREASL